VKKKKGKKETGVKKKERKEKGKQKKLHLQISSRGGVIPSILSSRDS